MSVRYAAILEKEAQTQLAAGTFTGPDLTVGEHQGLAVDLNLTALGGAGPTLDLYVDRKGADGVYYQINNPTQLGATGSVSRSLGRGSQVNVELGCVIRVRVTLGGAGPSATWTLSVQAN